MLNTIQALLDTFPEGVVQVRDGTILAVNAMAACCLPQLRPGGPVPQWLLLPKNGPSGSGMFTAGAGPYTYSCSEMEEGYVVLFRPAGQTALTGQQLEGALRQLRALLGEILAEVGPATAAPGVGVPAGAFGKSFHRLFRLVENLEFMRRTDGEDRVEFRPVTMDLEGLCRHIVDRAYPLLREAGVSLAYESVQNSLLIPGAPALLRRMLLELIGNAARAAGEGQVVLSLRRQGDRALLTVSDNGPLLDQRQVAALFQWGGGDIPLPGQGAGLGLPIARHIVALHRGSLLVSWGQSAPSVMVSLPTGPLDGRITVSTPTSQTDGGLDPVMVELSDVLPASLFGLEGLD